MARNSEAVRDQIVMAPETVHFDPDAFDLSLRSNGVSMKHYRAIKCPIGITDKFDVRDHGEHNCSHGFLYKYAGEVTVFFSNNSSGSAVKDLGIINNATTAITIPRTYDDIDEEIAVQHYDRFFLKDVVASSVNTQLVEAHITGVDRLQYNATSVEILLDANGVEYDENDFIIENNKLKWTTQRRPQFDPKLQKGTIYSIRYRYVPFWYVKDMVHEVRVCKTVDMATGAITTARMPYGIILQREYLFESEESRTNENESDSRDVKTPRSGSFGPR